MNSRFPACVGKMGSGKVFPKGHEMKAVNLQENGKVDLVGYNSFERFEVSRTSLVSTAAKYNLGSF